MNIQSLFLFTYFKMTPTLMNIGLFFSVLLVAEVSSSNQFQSFVKLKNIQCKTSHPDLVSLEECQILDKGNESRVQTLCYFKERPIVQINFRMKSYVKRPIGYVPFVIDINVDWCEFIVKRRNVILKRLFDLVEKYSNMHTKCPIDQDYIYLNASVGKNKGFYLPFKFPIGYYRLDFLITFNSYIKVATYVYFEVE